MSDILVTGGRGFIGTNLTAELRSRGHSVWTADIVQGEDERHFRVDVSHYQQLVEIFQKQQFDFVYHLAAEYGRWNGEDHYQNLWSTNVVGTKNMLRLQEDHRFRMIFFSSAEVYGDYDETMTEDVMEKFSIKQMNDYAISKWVGEMQCLNSAIMFDTETVRVRPVGCYGPHEYYSRYRGVIPIFVYKCLRGQPCKVYRGHKRIFDYVEDTCKTFANIADNFIPGEVYNVGGREDAVVNVEELFQVVCEETDSDPSRAEFHDAEPFTTRVKVVDFSKARRDLRHDPQIDLREGVHHYVEWMKSVYGEK